MDETFGTRLMRLRQRQNISQGELATIAGIQQSMLSMLERGSRKWDKLQVGAFLRLAETLGVSAEYLATGYARRRTQKPAVAGLAGETPHAHCSCTTGTGVACPVHPGDASA